MKRIALCFTVVSLYANTYYVSSTGSDSNSGSLNSPWLTLAHAVANVACGDTINVIANGSAVAGDVDLPYLAGCSSVTTIQSSKLSQFAPAAWRTNPTRDAAIYGRLALTGSGIRAFSESHGNNILFGGAGFVDCVATALANNTFTLACNTAPPTFANGTQVLFDFDSQVGSNAGPPSGFSIFTKYYVVNCSSSPACGQNNSTFQISSTPGGAALTGLSCNSPCQLNALQIAIPIQVTAGSASLVLPDDPTGWAAGISIVFSAAGLADFGSLPAPLQLDTEYWIVSLSGRSIQVSATRGGSPIILTSVGSGPLRASSTNVPSQWAFRGLEIVDGPNSFIFTLMQLGNGSDASNKFVPHHFEIDRCYIHSQNNSSEQRAIAENGAYNSIHDSYIAGISAGESQAIGGWSSPGPTAITNNFLESAGEVTLYGGNSNSSGTANSHKVFRGNYGYKPPTWRFQSGAGAASGPCLYDATDPNLAGGEWYTDTSTGQKYRCGSDGQWATTTLTWPGYGNPSVKTGFEHKNGQDFLYEGNVMNYNWAHLQQGQWFNNSEEPGSGPGMANDHITVVNNAIYNVYSFGNGVSLCGHTLLIPCVYTPHDHARVNNLAVLSRLTCGTSFNGSLCGFQPYQDTAAGAGDGTLPTTLAPPLHDDHNRHNTIFTPDSGWPRNFPNPIYAGSPGGCSFGPTMIREVYIDNIVPGDFAGDCFARGSVISSYFSNSTFSNNALQAGTSSGYGSVGATNTWRNVVYPANNAAIGYVSADGTINGDYHLSASSPYSAQNSGATQLSTDGTDLGADIDLVKMATSGAIAGTPPWDQQAALRVVTGSTELVFRYQAPAAGTCTATIYRAPARIATNQVASVPDSSASSVVDGPDRQLYVSGLMASTHYWYKLACGGGVLMVGDFQTAVGGNTTVQESFDWSTPTAMRYSSSRDMSNAVSLPAATRQVIPVGPNGLVYAQVGTSGPITILIAP